MQSRKFTFVKVSSDHHPLPDLPAGPPARPPHPPPRPPHILLSALSPAM